MYPNLREILELLEEMAPAAFAEAWDNPGLQVGSFSQNVKKVFVSLDPTLKAVRAAATRKAQMLFTHHPLIFRPLSQLDLGVYPGNVIFEAINNDISVVAAHTNLDVAPGGINDILAGLLGLKKVEVLKELEGHKDVGMGRIGELSCPLSLPALLDEIKKVLGVTRPKVVVQKNDKIRRIAVVGGSGGSLISYATKKGADLLLTGDLSHHQALEAESMGLSLIDAGHFYTEKAAMMIFGSHLKKAFSKRGFRVVVEIDEGEVNPIHEG